MRELIELTDERPLLRDPVLIVGLGVRRMAGRLASNALGHVVSAWNAELIAKIESDGFLDHSVRRPQVRRPDDTQIIIDWPDTTIYRATPPGSNRDFLLLVGFEPNFYWLNYVDLLSRYVDGLGVRELICLRSFPGSVPHTRPAPVLINASDVELELQFGVQSRRSRYEGPTDLSGVLAAQGQQLGWQTVDLTVLQPYYFPRMPNATAMTALIKVLDHAFGTDTPVDDLRQTAEEQLRTVSDTVAADPEMRSVLDDLEERFDSGAERMEFLTAEAGEQEGHLPTGEELVEEIEKLLREGDGPES